MDRWLGFEWVRTCTGWKRNTWIKVDDGGAIRKMVANAGQSAQEANAHIGNLHGEPGTAEVVPADVRWIGGIAIPGIPNVHSHAFQWTFAGHSERRTAVRDSFWTWRDQMYRVVESIDPDLLFAQSVQLYRMMAGAGYTSVGEFHYVHHRPDGAPYERLELLADVVIRAATVAGLRICLLPVVYQRGGFDDRPLAGSQRRFALSGDQALEMLDALKAGWGDHPLVQFGLALHSLRAVAPQKIGDIANRFSQAFPDAPIHIHVAEQTAEVEQCLAVHGCRPVELLLDRADVDGRWCLIHATHMTDAESERLAATGAMVGVCPTTEANLGDGVFAATRWREHGGRWAIGSDSHVAIDPWSELRMMEYAQRLVKRGRALLCDNRRSCGQWLFDHAVTAGRCAVGLESWSPADGGPGMAGLAVGAAADLVVLNSTAPALEGVEIERVLDRAVFCEWGPIVAKTMVQGRWVAGDADGTK